MPSAAAQALVLVTAPGNSPWRSQMVGASSPYGAFLIPIPQGQTALQVATAWLGTQAFPVGTTLELCDLTGVSMSGYTSNTSWVPV